MKDVQKPQKTMLIPSIYEFFNYRDYLGTYYQARKENESWFSYRSFARAAGYNSSGLYPNLVNGLRNLTARYIPGFCKALKLNPKESEYFQLMVEYTNAVSERGRQELFSKMIPYLPEKARRLKQNHREFYSNWYNVVIHQALSIVNIADDPSPLMAFLVPAPGMREIRRALKLLEELELIVRDPDGCWRPASGNLTGGEEVGKIYISQFQQAMLELARQAWDRFPAADRYTITETYAVSQKVSEAIAERTRDFHREIIEMIVEDDAPEEELMQLNIQMFPLSEKKERSHESL